MFSEGKNSLQLGLVWLYLFVKVLEEDFNAVMRGVLNEYGAACKEQIDISQSLGWEKKRKRAPNPAAPSNNKKTCQEYKNDGRPPDTTDTLPPELADKKKTGRPPGARNVDRGALTTYPLYRASRNEKKANRCWMAAALETMYALYNPLWLCGSSGQGTSLFTTLVTHFTTRTTYQLKQAGWVRGMLAIAQQNIFQHAHNLHPASFKAGKFCSADFFIKISLDPKTNPNQSRQGLFDVEERQTLTCLAHPEAPRQDVRSRFVINIQKEMFEVNAILYSDTAELLRKWISNGLIGISGLHCRDCAAKAKEPKKCKQTGASGIFSALKKEDSITDGMLRKRSTISFPKNQAPLHLYFMLDVASILDWAKQAMFMSTINWPSAFTVLMNVSGVAGIWYHNDMENDGLARMLDASEKAYVNEKVVQIKKDFPTARPHQILFSNLGDLLDSERKFLESTGENMNDVAKTDHSDVSPTLPSGLAPKRPADDSPFANLNPASSAEDSAITAEITPAKSANSSSATEEKQAAPKIQKLKIKLKPPKPPKPPDEIGKIGFANVRAPRHLRLNSFANFCAYSQAWTS
ncbi:hypothetical protein PTTG_29858 [Puccinia triticina 1-1 BBBD Race 1]|uniref:Uncharacterized protein n=1 Tax=Puccinia triticina (isolate 1-1 / race 1 (BBBD)) TaxID=630390 RepID=A0A180G274_PUCT1|nr:hypothetical protein PTTG_29858 [Puccinia triticina 1-1 BBBD Race 1]